MKPLRMLTLLIFTISAIGCQQSSSDPSPAAKSVDSNLVNTVSQSEPNPLIEGKKMASQDIISVTGKIEYKTFEGGFYAFIADDGRQFTPQGLPPEYRQHGLVMTLTGTPMPDVMTITQFGVVFKVDSIVKVDESHVKTGSPIPVNPADI